MLEVPDMNLHVDLDLNMVTGLWYTHDLILGSILILKTSMSFKS